MTTILILLSIMIGTTTTEYKIDFGIKSVDQNWFVVNDGVMGGLSSSNSEVLENSLLFKGNISLKNNGGFSSLRGPKNNVNLSQYKNIEIKYRSKGQDFGLRLMEYDAYYMPYFKYLFDDTSWEWQTVKISLKEFNQYRLSDITGKKMSKENLSNIGRIGIIVSNKMNKTVVVITHNSAIAGMADRVIKLGSGRIIDNYINTKVIKPEEVVW